MTSSPRLHGSALAAMLAVKVKRANAMVATQTTMCTSYPGVAPGRPRPSGTAMACLCTALAVGHVLQPTKLH